MELNISEWREKKRPLWVTDVGVESYADLPGGGGDIRQDRLPQDWARYSGEEADDLEQLTLLLEGRHVAEDYISCFLLMKVLLVEYLSLKARDYHTTSIGYFAGGLVLQGDIRAMVRFTQTGQPFETAAAAALIGRFVMGDTIVEHSDNRMEVHPSLGQDYRQQQHHLRQSQVQSVFELILKVDEKVMRQHTVISSCSTVSIGCSLPCMGPSWHAGWDSHALLCELEPFVQNFPLDANERRSCCSTKDLSKTPQPFAK